MRNFLNKHYNKIMFILIFSVLIVFLTSCRTAQGVWQNKGFTNWAEEFHFNDFMDGFMGWPISILSYPFAWLTHAIGQGLGNSYFWGIFFVTIIVRTAFWPVYSKSNDATFKMQMIKPEMDKIERKYMYKNDPISKQAKQKEIMALYKKNKINPLGCALNMFIQFPVFIAMFEVVKRINLDNSLLKLENTKIFGFFEMNGTSAFSGGSANQAFCIVVALIYAGISFFSMKLSQKPPRYVKKQYNNNKTDRQNQQMKMMKTMNIVMVVMFAVFALQSTALSVYWLIAAIFQLFQQSLTRKLNENKYYKLHPEQKVYIDVNVDKNSFGYKTKKSINSFIEKSNLTIKNLFKKEKSNSNKSKLNENDYENTNNSTTKEVIDVIIDEKKEDK